MEPDANSLHDGIVLYHQFQQHSMKLYEVLIRLKVAGSVFPLEFRHTVKQNSSVLFYAVETEGHSDMMKLWSDRASPSPALLR